MRFALKNIVLYPGYLLVLWVIFITTPLFSQNQDSILNKVKELDISLDAPVDEEEDLYLNTVSFQSFYDVLSPMGEWIQITKEDLDEDLSDGEGEGRMYAVTEEDFLFIWKPGVEQGWKPYSNGRWEYSEQGWFWASNDKWGNSTYNYGRWWNSPKYGWVWLPGYTWAPAWVRWRVSNDGNSIGWVPLSPKAKWKSESGITDKNYHYRNSDKDWVFVDNNTFTGDINNSIVSDNNNSELVKNSSSIIEIKAENDKIITGGPDVNAIEQKTNKKFTRKRLRFHKDNGNAIVGENEIIVGREKFQKGQNEKLGKPNKFKKSERVKKWIKKHRNGNKPPIRKP